MVVLFVYLLVSLGIAGYGIYNAVGEVKRGEADKLSFCNSLLDSFFISLTWPFLLCLAVAITPLAVFGYLSDLVFDKIKKKG